MIDAARLRRAGPEGNEVAHQMRRVRRRSLRSLGVVWSALTLLAISANPALADFQEVPDQVWMTNGTLFSVVRAGSYVYVGGSFTSLRSTPPGVKGPAVRTLGIGRLDAATGVGDKTWKVEVTRTDGKRATVFAIAVADGKVFFGGRFDRVNGQPRLNFAAVSETGALLDPNVTAQVGTGFDTPIRTMIASGTRVYAGGYFTSVDGTARRYLAAFDTDGSLVDQWAPRTTAHVRSLVFDCDGDVIAGGAFQTAAGTTGSFVGRDKVAVFDETDGSLQAWATRDAEVDNGMTVFDLATGCAGGRLYAGIGGQNWIYAFDLSDDDGEVVWRRQTSGNVNSVAVNEFGTASTTDDRVYFGGHFGGGVTYPSGACSIAKPKTARFGVTDIHGNCDLSWWPTFDGKFQGPWDLLVTDNGTRVWVGGQFTLVCDGSQSPSPCVDRYFLARFTNV
jgi:hypothetical protein